MRKEALSLKEVKQELGKKFDTSFNIKLLPSVGIVSPICDIFIMSKDSLSLKNDIGIKGVLIDGRIKPVRFNQIINFDIIRSSIVCRIGPKRDSVVLNGINYELTIHKIENNDYILSVTDINSINDINRCREIINDDTPFKVYYDFNKNYPFTSPKRSYRSVPLGLFVPKKVLNQEKDKTIQIIRTIKLSEDEGGGYEQINLTSFKVSDMETFKIEQSSIEIIYNRSYDTDTYTFYQSDKYTISLNAIQDGYCINIIED